MVRPAGWSVCGSSPTVLPSRRGGIIGRQKGVTFESKLTFESGIGAAQFARALNQTELKMLGAWFNPKTKKYEPPSKSVIYRVREKADPAAMESLKRWSMPRLNIDTALAADGKRLRGANRNGVDF